MANTEGLTDEALSSLLALPSADEQQRLNSRPQHKSRAADGIPFPRRSLAQREQLMELGEGERPAATVIRASKPPTIHSASSLKKGVAVAERDPSLVDNNGVKHPESDNDANPPDGNVVENNANDTSTKTNPRPVMLSDSIRERPVRTACSTNFTQIAAGTKPRISRFKQRTLEKNGFGISVSPTAGGFPSLDRPVGSLTRKGRGTSRVGESRGANTNVNNTNTNKPSYQQQNVHKEPQLNSDASGVGTATHSMLANMSIEEIREGVDEIKSILSAESIEFLRMRGKKKLAQSTGVKNTQHNHSIALSTVSTLILSKEAEIEFEEQRVRDEKEKTARLLSSVRTPEDMDRAYDEALRLGLATELPSSTLGSADPTSIVGSETLTEHRRATAPDELRIATSLLRSTAPRQRLLGARSVCSILEKDVDIMMETRSSKSHSSSYRDITAVRDLYPPLLPVALRCLLDESVAASQTTGGRVLLSLVLRCMHSLMMLSVHPYQLVCVNQTKGNADPFRVFQTWFMSDVSHVPSGSELYPPTTIKPIENEQANGSCYRADSSASTAESDSKAFYNDPAWTLLSRMRILPCLSDVLMCLSKDVSSGVVVPTTSIGSVCGILAMLSVRSAGAAGAIARHKGLLPFIVSYCLSPVHQNVENNDESERSFRAYTVRPALILLCHLAQQSQDIAELEFPFQSIFPDLQAILCLGDGKEEELDVQMWSLVLIRILFRYGLCFEQVQTLIGLSASYVASPKCNTIASHYFTLYSHICDGARAFSSSQNNTVKDQMSTITEDLDCLVMSGVWLSSPVKSCTTSLQASMNKVNDKEVSAGTMQLAASQLCFIASYLSAAASAYLGEDVQDDTKTSFIPIVSRDSCVEVYEAVLGSHLLEHALEIALRRAFCAYWNKASDSRSQSMEEEAAACAFVSSFMKFVKAISDGNLEKARLYGIVLNSLQKARSSHQSTTIDAELIHPGRQSWFVEAEYCLLAFLCTESNKFQSTSLFLSAFAFSLVGRLGIGNEAIADFIFNQDSLFQVNSDTENIASSNCSLQRTFSRELSDSNDRMAQLDHSSRLHGKGPFELSSLRCRANFSGKAKGREEDRLLLPVGEIWLWNVLSSTVTYPSNSAGNAISDEEAGDKPSDIISHTLGLLLQLEVSTKSAAYPSLINNGTKLYHVANVCLFPEEILRDSFIGSAITSLYKQFTCNDSNGSSTLIGDFIKACFNHSRLSKRHFAATRGERTSATEQKLRASLEAEQSRSEDVSKDEMRALNDFISDMCDSYIEYGGQYSAFTNFMRLFLRHDFPPKTITIALAKLHPILHVLTMEEEEREATYLTLFQSISGGLPSLDSSQRDPGIVLDSFADALKKKDKELQRNDYVYLLAIAVLSRNLASSSQRCECGLQAMKQRLTGVRSSVFYDITQVSRQFLCDKIGSKDRLVSCVLGFCLNETNSLSAQEESVQTIWQWDDGREGVWERAISALKGSCD
ncbi:predicted protein [Thalassiosira pseudonana CCMP1335]|uniref:Uncharacterized protein n=1 Tax=Thalassiosira pseudonana TaxID=35128 RepID=B8BQA5_THAPS|nr:predicted protein [Thalassiosira pseudonana CCMP1335]EED95749.1 predicted protein [Thalassiosira pseudonana CCMP1335]